MRVVGCLWERRKDVLQKGGFDPRGRKFTVEKQLHSQLNFPQGIHAAKQNTDLPSPWTELKLSVVRLPWTLWFPESSRFFPSLCIHTVPPPSPEGSRSGLDTEEERCMNLKMNAYQSQLSKMSKSEQTSVTSGTNHEVQHTCNYNPQKEGKRKKFMKK